MTADIEAMLGGDSPGTDSPALLPGRRRRRAAPPPVEPEIDLETIDLDDVPDSTVIVRQNAIRQAGMGRAFIEGGQLRRPVSKNFLALLFDMDPATVTKRLLECPSVGMAGGGRPVYDFRTAIGYLIPPKMDIAAYIESIDPNDLPNHINRFYWGARRERLKFMLEAGQAWASEDVLDVLGKVFLSLKGWMQQLPDTLRERCNLTDEQFALMTSAADAQQNELHQQLIEMPRVGRTRSLAVEVDGDEREPAES
jgi:hypothetical protein